MVLCQLQMAQPGLGAPLKEADSTKLRLIKTVDVLVDRISKLNKRANDHVSTSSAKLSKVDKQLTAIQADVQDWRESDAANQIALEAELLEVGTAYSGLQEEVRTVAGLE